MQLKTSPAVAALEDRLSLRHSSLKIFLAARLDLDLRDLGDHVSRPLICLVSVPQSTATVKRTASRVQAALPGAVIARTTKQRQNAPGSGRTGPMGANAGNIAFRVSGE